MLIRLNRTNSSLPLKLNNILKIPDILTFRRLTNFYKFNNHLITAAASETGLERSGTIVDEPCGGVEQTYRVCAVMLQQKVVVWQHKSSSIGFLIMEYVDISQSVENIMDG